MFVSDKRLRYNVWQGSSEGIFVLKLIASILEAMEKSMIICKYDHGVQFPIRMIYSSVHINKLP